MLVDSFDRTLTYLRVSVTNRCNLRCAYCTPPEGPSYRAEEDFLGFEEITRIVGAAVRLGMRKIRITGGEPLVRPGIERLVAAVGRIEGLRTLALSTNGVLLADKARALYEAGVQRINMSLDTLRPERFRRITLEDRHAQALRGLAAAEALPFDKIKLNVVISRGFNEDELLDFVRLTFERPLTVRFIELMPVGRTGWGTAEKFVPAREMKERIEALGRLQPAPDSLGEAAGPARVYRLPGATGLIGFIPAVSEAFCDRCNRLRLTPDGKLRSCLISGEEVDLRPALRSGAGEGALEERFRQAARQKPEKHQMDRNTQSHPLPQLMSQIGG